MKQVLFISLMIAMLLSITTSCGKDEAEQPSEQSGNQNGQGGQNGGDDNQEGSTPPIIVTVDANGNADGGHHFVNIDGISFYIDDIKYTASQGSLIVTGYNEAFFSGEAKIISQLNYNGHEMHVKEIGEKAFRGCEVITSVIISEGITSIGKYAFADCTGLTSVAIPSSVTSIGESDGEIHVIAIDEFAEESTTHFNMPAYLAFEGCTDLASITVTNGNPICDSRSNCNAIIDTYSNTLVLGCKNTIIPSSVTSIGGFAFKDCTGLTSMTIPSSVTSIEGYAFKGCTSLTSMTIPSSVTSIGYGAFSDTPYYNDQPDGVFYAGNIAYTYKGTMPENTSIIIKRGTRKINDNAFEGKINLTSITIPESVTSIGSYAFSRTGLTSVTIPSSVTSIGNAAFYDCWGLTSVSISPSVTSIGKGTFSQCGLTSVTIPEGVSSIEYKAFGGCRNLTSVTIPSSVTSIGRFAFYDYGCNNIYDITSHTDLYCYAETVPATDSSAFESISYSATLHVPASAIDAYKTTAPWSRFGRIVPIQ